VNWGEIYRTRAALAERGQKPGFYVVVSRDFVARNDALSTVICAPVYSEFLGLRSEVPVGLAEGLPRDSAVRCDFLMLMLKSRLTTFVSLLPAAKQDQLRKALAVALQID
jgi:mRNA interferase MazF